MITTLTDALKGILGLNKQISEEEIECAIDEQTVDCAVMEEEPAYTGVPAPAVLQDDPGLDLLLSLARVKITWKKKQRSSNKKKRIVSIGRMNLKTFTK